MPGILLVGNGWLRQEGKSIIHSQGVYRGQNLFDVFLYRINREVGFGNISLIAENVYCGLIIENLGFGFYLSWHMGWIPGNFNHFEIRLGFFEFVDGICYLSFKISEIRYEPTTNRIMKLFFSSRKIQSTLSVIMTPMNVWDFSNSSMLRCFNRLNVKLQLCEKVPWAYWKNHRGRAYREKCQFCRLPHAFEDRVQFSPSSCRRLCM